MFSGFETVLISAIMAVLSAGGAILGMTKKFVAKTDCAYHHNSVIQSDTEIKARLAQISDKQDLQFKMLRTMILHMELPADKKSDLLNM
jgi:hypothetical protein